MSSHSSNLIKASGICGIVAPILAFTCIFLAITYSPHFFWTENALSDLGIQEGLTAVLFNYGLIFSGILTLIFAAGLLMFLRRKSLGGIGAFVFLLAAIALTSIGAFPENARPMHYYASVAFFMLAPISLLLIAANFLFMGEVKMGLFTFLVALAAASVWIVQFTLHFVQGVAIPETVSTLSASTWSMVMGCRMLKEASHLRE